MASGGAFSRSVVGGSEETFDFMCNSCDNDKKTSEAQHYCTDCDQFYCKSCVKVHTNIPALKSHHVLGRNKIKRWGEQRSSVSMPTEICAKHSGKTVEMYCVNHDVTCCHVCVSLDHRLCKDLQYILDVSKGIVKSKEFITTKRFIELSRSNTEKIKEIRQQKKVNLQNTKKNTLQNIKDLRQRVNKVFDSLEKKVTDNLEMLYRDNDAHIQEDINVCDNILTELLQLEQQLETTMPVNEPQTFVHMKHSERKLLDANKILQSIFKTPRNDSLRLTADPKLENFLASIESIGKIEMRLIVPEVKFQKQHETLQHTAVTAQNGRDYNVRMKKDKKACSIAGSCQMPDGTILLTDYINSNLKRLDTSYIVTDHCGLPNKPKAVCCTGPQEAAVSASNKTIYFISVGNKMSITRSIDMDHFVCGIAYHNDQLYVTDAVDKKVYIYTTTGRCVRTIDKHHNGTAMFDGNTYIAVSDHGNKIYVADYKKGLITLDKTGQHLSTFSDSQFVGAFGVSVHDDGSVFVTGWESGNVIQVDEWGKQKIGEVVTGVEYPGSVCVDKLQSTILVTTNIRSGHDTVRVFDFK